MEKQARAITKAEAIRLWKRGILTAADVERQMLTPDRRPAWDVQQMRASRRNA